MNSTVEKLAQSVTRASELYRVPQNSKETEDTASQVPMFLSQISLDDYTATEEKFRKELAAFTRKQFFEVIIILKSLDKSCKDDISILRFL